MRPNPAVGSVMPNRLGRAGLTRRAPAKPDSSYWPPPRLEGATGAIRSLPLLGRNVPVVPTQDRLRAVRKAEFGNPESVSRHLAVEFGDQFEPARAASDANALLTRRLPLLTDGQHR